MYYIDFIITFLNNFINRYNNFAKQLRAYKFGINLIYKLLKILYKLK